MEMMIVMTVTEIDMIGMDTAQVGGAGREAEIVITVDVAAGNNLTLLWN